MQLVHYKSIQILRFLAAAIVVVAHATQAYLIKVQGTDGSGYWHLGTFGVDVFFVISGFVMVAASDRLGRNLAAAWLFLKRRFVRVVPLYWFYTTAKIAIVFLFPFASEKEVPSFFHIISSYLFFPFEGRLGGYWPVLPVGWTLNFEMFFYICFALSILFFRNRIVGVIFFFSVVAALACYFDDGWILFYKDSVLIEFLFGMVIARWAGQVVSFFRGARYRTEGAVILFIVALLFAYFFDSGARGVFWGVPAAFILIGALMLEPLRSGPVSSVLSALGGSSYSLYLSHTFTVPVVVLIFSVKFGFGLPSTVFLCIVISVLVSEFLYLFVEKPLVGFFSISRSSSGFKKAGSA